MRAWISNDVRALSQVPKELWAEAADDVDLPPNKDVSALGIKWNPRDDTFGFRIGAPVAAAKFTKRTVLSDVMRVYDPLGLISPITIKGRIFIQRLWRERLNWDDEIPINHKIFWDQWREELAAIASRKLCPRNRESEICDPFPQRAVSRASPFDELTTDSCGSTHA
ncbi:pao retrotransposon peptidase domain-containing protein [Phthorimaea operculella]|nr:pao retrotransposon peptidase domain-containing protein [Phthorimaea operculella]